MKRAKRAKADSFLEAICLFRPLIFILFVIAIVMFLLSLISLGVVDAGSETYVIAQLNLIGLSVMILVSGIALYLCRNQV